MDSKYLAVGRRYRRNEHYAGVGNRENERDRTEKSTGSKEKENSCTVFDRSGGIDEYWGNFRSVCRNDSGKNHFHDFTDPSCYQCAGSFNIRIVFYGNRTDIWTASVN